MSLPYQRHSRTSKKAARYAKPYATTARYKVYQFIEKNPGKTDEEIQDTLRMNPNTQRPRRVELLEIGIIEEEGRKKNKSGTEASTWRITGAPYPHPWPETQKKETRPTPKQFRQAAKELGRILKYRLKRDLPFDPVLIVVHKWMKKQ
jgi:hypothetical protein